MHWYSAQEQTEPAVAHSQYIGALNSFLNSLIARKHVTSLTLPCGMYVMQAGPGRVWVVKKITDKKRAYREWSSFGLLFILSPHKKTVLINCLTNFKFEIASPHRHLWYFHHLWRVFTRGIHDCAAHAMFIYPTPTAANFLLILLWSETKSDANSCLRAWDRLIFIDHNFALVFNRTVTNDARVLVSVFLMNF